MENTLKQLADYAEVSMRQRNFKEALNRWAVVREKFPKNHEGYSRAAAAYMELQDFAQAENFCKDGMEKIPNLAPSFITYAEVSMRQRNFKEALTRWTVVREKFPNFYQIRSKTPHFRAVI